MFRIGIVLLLFLSNGICDDNSVVSICSAAAAIAAPATPATNRRTEHLLYHHIRPLHRRA